MDGGNGASAKPIYNLFTEKSIKLSDIILFITPSRWFAGGKGLDKFRKMMMLSDNLVLINHFDDACKIFGKGVDISGGVSYFLYNINYKGICKFNSTYIDLKTFDIVIKNPSDLNIISKFCKNTNITKISNPRSYFGVPTKIDDIQNSKISDEYIKCYFSKSKGFEKWIKKSEVKKLDMKYRVATPRANGDKPNFGNLFILSPNECVSDSYISFFVDTESQAESLLSYLKCKLANYLLSLRKISNTIKPDTCKWIPMVPFDREWTDELLFEYFDLTEEEQKIILG
jgi:site-specific DNA-methyltransferase (adenine-specific)